MGYGSNYGGTGYGDSGMDLQPPTGTSPQTDWTVFAEVGTRGGWIVDVPGPWSEPGSYQVYLQHLGGEFQALGLPGDGLDCTPRTGRLLPAVTPPLSPGLYRVRVVLADVLDTVIPEVLRVLRDDLPWQTFALRRLIPGSVYAVGARRAKEDR